MGCLITYNYKKRTKTSSMNDFLTQFNSLKLSNFYDIPKNMIEPLNFDSKFFFDVSLGEGTFGFTLKIIEKENNTEYALKVLPKENFKNKEVSYNILNYLMNIKNEINYNELNNIINFFDNEDSIFIIQNLANFSLKYVINNEKLPLNKKRTKKIMNDIFYSLFLLNKNNFIHGNLIPENILFFQSQNSLKYNLKLNDFSYYLYFEHKRQKKYNYYFYSPEVLLFNDYSIKSDIWSAGIIMYILLLGKFPFIGEDIDKLKNNIINQEIDFNNNDNIMLDDLEKDLLIRLLEKNKEIRIKLDDILNHKYFDKNNFFLLENSSEENNKSFNSSEISENIILSINYLLKSFFIFIIIFNELNKEIINNIFYNYILKNQIIENYQEKIFKFIDDNSIHFDDRKIDQILNYLLINKIYLSENNVNTIFNFFKDNVKLNDDNIKLKNIIIYIKNIIINSNENLNKYIIEKNTLINDNLLNKEMNVIEFKTLLLSNIFDN